jgi:hypothetical protein
VGGKPCRPVSAPGAYGSSRSTCESSDGHCFSGCPSTSAPLPTTGQDVEHTTAPCGMPGAIDGRLGSMGMSGILGPPPARCSLFPSPPPGISCKRCRPWVGSQHQNQRSCANQNSNCQRYGREGAAGTVLHSHHRSCRGKMASQVFRVKSGARSAIIALYATTGSSTECWAPQVTEQAVS